MNHKHLITFGSVMVVAWVVSTFLFIYFWPHPVTNHFKRAIVDQGFGDGPVPINTLYTEPQRLFGDPLHTSLRPGSSNLMTVGVNHDTLLTVGWLDLSKEAQVLHVPDFFGRYYSVQFTDPFDVDFAYVGTRTTGTQVGDYLITGPDWQGTVPHGMKQMSSPSNSVLVIGRVFVESDSDLPTAYALAKQIQIVPLTPRQSSQYISDAARSCGPDFKRLGRKSSNEPESAISAGTICSITLLRVWSSTAFR
jgi:hypothetical protein